MWLWLLFGVVMFGGFMAFTGAPYVPSRRRDLAQAFTELYKLSSVDTLVDIGSGDGVVLRTAARYGARAVGYEINPALALIARWLSRHDRLVTVQIANFWRQKLPDETTVVYTFGDGRDIEKMYQLVLREATRLQRELVFISYGFAVPNVKSARSAGAYFLYRAKPLQADSVSV